MKFSLNQNRNPLRQFEKKEENIHNFIKFIIYIYFTENDWLIKFVCSVKAVKLVIFGAHLIRG